MKPEIIEYCAKKLRESLPEDYCKLALLRIRQATKNNVEWGSPGGYQDEINKYTDCGMILNHGICWAETLEGTKFWEKLTEHCEEGSKRPQIKVESIRDLRSHENDKRLV